MIKVAVTPEVNAISTLLMLLTLVMIIIAGKLEARDMQAPARSSNESRSAKNKRQVIFRRRCAAAQSITVISAAGADATHRGLQPAG